MKDKTISSRMEKLVDDSLYEIIEFNESKPIIFQKDKKKKQQQQQLCKTAKSTIVAITNVLRWNFACVPGFALLCIIGSAGAYLCNQKHLF